MRVKTKKNKRKRGLRNINQLPGQVVYVGNRKNVAIHYEVFQYNADNVTHFKTNDLDEIWQKWEDDKITWLDINGLNHPDQIEKIGSHFGIHKLALEDLVNTDQRAKIDEYENYIFLVLKVGNITENGYQEEHLGIIIGSNYLLTFQETEADVFDKIRERIANNIGQIRTRQSDYLAYALLDVIVDHYFLVTDNFGERIESLESSIFLGNANDEIVELIQNLRPEVFRLRRAVLPLREISLQLQNSEHKLINKKNYNYFRDLHDNSLQISENVEMYREMMRGVMEMYISTINNKMNEVMKVLTIVATIFIPLTFIAGVYGMNFDNMPELHFKYAYFYVWGIMLLVILLMIWYFRRKKWM